MLCDDDKIKIAKEYVDGSLGLKSLAKKYGIKSHNSIKGWVIKFNIKGERNLIGAGTYKDKNSYSGTFKQTVVKYFLEHGDYIYETAEKFNISIGALERWIKEYKEGDTILALKDKNGDTITMSKVKKNEDPTVKQNEDLLLENEKLRAEVEYLKKLNALTQKILKSESQKK